jgi:hypothetical protein
MTILGFTVAEFFAFYGAGLSTVLALLKLAHPRPVVGLEMVASGSRSGASVHNQQSGKIPDHVDQHSDARRTHFDSNWIY